MSHSLRLNIPSPFYEAWFPLLELGGSFLELPCLEDNNWVMGALARKTATSMFALGALASLDLWGEALVLGRTLFETELRAKELLSGPYAEKVGEYLDNVSVEQARLQRKAEAGRSVTAQVLAEIRVKDQRKGGDSRRRKSVRDRTKQFDMERLYDLPYWIASIFSHAGILSLSEWNKELAIADPQLSAMFRLSHVDLPCWLTLSGIPTSAIRTYRLVDSHLQLGFRSRIDHAHGLLKHAIAETSNVMFDPSIPLGTVTVRSGRNDHDVKTFTPNRD